jgi:hypothetical protein
MPASARVPVNMAPSRNHLAPSTALANWGSATLSSPSAATDESRPQLFLDGRQDAVGNGSSRLSIPAPLPQPFIEEVALRFGVDGDYRKVLLDEVQVCSMSSNPFELGSELGSTRLYLAIPPSRFAQSAQGSTCLRVSVAYTGRWLADL